MRSLFLKIFLWFWLATVLVAGIYVVFEIYDPPRPQPARRRATLGNIISLYGEHAVERWEEAGQAGLREYTDHLHKTAEVDAVLYDGRGKELSGRSVPLGAADLAAQLADGGDLEIQHTATGLLIAARITGQNGQPYVVVAHVLRGPLADMLARPADWVWRFAAMTVMGGLVCYGLARYLTAPIRSLRVATRQLAHGDLSVRVAARTAPRRDEIGELGRDFDFMAARVEALLTGQQRLLRDISHELRSPLARLSVALELARQNSGANGAAALDRIEREAERLSELVSQLLTLARLENDVRGLPPVETLDLSALVQEIAADADFEASGMRRHVCLAACAACSLRGIPTLLRSAIENVVRNAVRHTAEGTSVEIRLTTTAGPGGDRATIEVRDHGPGVPEAALTDIFRPFYRVADARERDTGGTGLGLAITERAVHLHEGGVAAANAPGGGLIVRIELPCNGAAAGSEPRRPARDSTGATSRRG